MKHYAIIPCLFVEYCIRRYPNQVSDIEWNRVEHNCELNQGGKGQYSTKAAWNICFILYPIYWVIAAK